MDYYNLFFVCFFATAITLTLALPLLIVLRVVRAITKSGKKIVYVVKS